MYQHRKLNGMEWNRISNTPFEKWREKTEEVDREKDAVMVEAIFWRE